MRNLNVWTHELCLRYLQALAVSMSRMCNSMYDVRLFCAFNNIIVYIDQRTNFWVIPYFCLFFSLIFYYFLEKKNRFAHLRTFVPQIKFFTYLYTVEENKNIKQEIYTI